MVITPTKATAHKTLREKLLYLRDGPPSKPAQAVEEKDLAANVISLGGPFKASEGLSI